MNTIKLIILSMRPQQWIKNVLIFAALVFSQNITNTSMLLINTTAFLVFAILSGGIYILNDLFDLEEDKNHPVKRERPLASGLLDPFTARIAFVGASLLALLASYWINAHFFLVSLTYFAIQSAYSLFFKHVVIIDVFFIAGGFFLRVIAGAVAITVPVSSWLLVCSFFISLFLALCKRRHEISLLEGGAVKHRKVLGEYNIHLLDQMISVMTSSTLIAYTLYTLSEETASKFHTTSLIYTIPFVLYGIYRYLYLVYQKDEGGHPEVLFLTDRPMFFNLLFYVLAVLAILYFPGGNN